MTQPILAVSNLSKIYTISGADGRREDLIAVDDVSFSVERGSCVAIVGESGSGKTTTARMIAGLELATAGRVDLDGVQIVGDGTPKRSRRPRQIQMVFQDPFGSLDPRQKIGDSINELLVLHGRMPKPYRRRRILELLDQVGLDPRHATEYPRSLSGGQRQRVAIARALALEPTVLILDEAVSALDVSVQAQVLNLLSDIREATAITYVFVSHDLAVVRQISDRCIVMQHGLVVESGCTADILDDPQQRYTQQLLAAVPGPDWVPKRRSLAP